MRVIAIPLVIVVAGLSAAFSPSAFADAVAPSGAISSSAVRQAVSPPLRDMPLTSSSATREEQKDEGPIPIPFPSGTRPVPDGALQTLAPTKVNTTDLLKFQGIGLGFHKFMPPTNADRPDANGAVGATQYVQGVNASFAVFDKATFFWVPSTS